jgi:hypothetical protein
MNTLDYISESLETIFRVKILKFFDADPGFGNFFDPGSGTRVGKNSDLGSGINIPDPQHCNFRFSSASILSYINQILTLVM